MGLKRTPLTSSFRMLLILCGLFKKKSWLPVAAAALSVVHGPAVYYRLPFEALKDCELKGRVGGLWSG